MHAAAEYAALIRGEVNGDERLRSSRRQRQFNFKIRTEVDMQTPKDWKREVAEYILALFIVVLFAFMFIAFAAVLNDPNKGFKSSESASWVQAIGSIAAIFGAYMFGERQAKHAHKNALDTQDRDRARKNMAFLAICTAAASHIEMIERVFCSRPYDEFRRLAEFNHSNTSQIIRALQIIPAHEVGSTDAVTALLRIIDSLQWLVIYIEEFDVDLRNMELPDPMGMGREESARGHIGRTVEAIQYDYRVLQRELKID
jgi:hypothetical protein